jgi:hypothetical protein
LFGGFSIDFNKIRPMPEALRETTAGSRSNDAMKLYIQYTRDLLRVAENSLSIIAKDTRELWEAFTRKYAGVRESDAFALGEQLCGNIRDYGAATWYDWSTTNWNTKWLADSANARKPRAFALSSFAYLRMF